MHVCSAPDGEHVPGRHVYGVFVHAGHSSRYNGYTHAGHAHGKHALDGLAPVGCVAGSEVYSGGQSGAEGVEYSTSRFGQVIGLLHLCQKACPSLSSLGVRVVFDLLSCMRVTHQACQLTCHCLNGPRLYLLHLPQRSFLSDLQTEHAS